MEETMHDRIVVATYNALADAYVKPEYFPRVDPRAFDRASRYPRVADRVLRLGADVVCLQEVDRPLFDLLERRLGDAGYDGSHAPKRAAGKPDGCATFFRRALNWRGRRVIAYDDGGAAVRTGHVALIDWFVTGAAMLAVVNTHLKWEAPDAPEDARVGLAQARQLVRELAAVPLPQIVCGDFNAEHGGAIMETFRAAGFADAHLPMVATCAPNGRAVKIDHLLHAGGLVATPISPTRVTDDAAFPSEEEPSDHVPIAAAYRLG
jgi:mRNA deadenylase 3'-5' endonuclease subunit Ccr4